MREGKFSSRSFVWSDSLILLYFPFSFFSFFTILPSLHKFTQELFPVLAHLRFSGIQEKGMKKKERINGEWTGFWRGRKLKRGSFRAVRSFPTILTIMFCPDCYLFATFFFPFYFFYHSPYYKFLWILSCIRVLLDGKRQEWVNERGKGWIGGERTSTSGSANSHSSTHILLPFTLSFILGFLYQVNFNGKLTFLHLCLSHSQK